MIRALDRSVGRVVDALAVFAVRGENALESGQVEPWARDECGRACDEVEGFEDDVGCAVSEGLLEFVDDLPALVGGEALIGNGRAADLTVCSSNLSRRLTSQTVGRFGAS